MSLWSRDWVVVVGHNWLLHIMALELADIIKVWYNFVSIDSKIGRLWRGVIWCGLVAQGWKQTPTLGSWFYNGPEKHGGNQGS